MDRIIKPTAEQIAAENRITYDTIRNDNLQEITRHRNAAKLAIVKWRKIRRVVATLTRPGRWTLVSRVKLIPSTLYVIRRVYHECNARGHATRSHRPVIIEPAIVAQWGDGGWTDVHGRLRPTTSTGGSVQVWVPTADSSSPSVKGTR